MASSCCTLLLRKVDEAKGGERQRERERAQCHGVMPSRHRNVVVVRLRWERAKRGRGEGEERARTWRCVIVARWMRQGEVYLSSSVSGSRPQIITKIVAHPKSRP